MISERISLAAEDAGIEVFTSRTAPTMEKEKQGGDSSLGGGGVGGGGGGGGRYGQEKGSMLGLGSINQGVKGLAGALWSILSSISLLVIIR